MVTRRAPRSTLQRAVLPVLGGIGFFALLGLATWGVASLLADNPDRVNETLAATTFDVGNINTLAEIVTESGPLILPDLMRAGGNRTVVVDHTGDDPRENWRLFFAYPSDRSVDCKVRQVRGTRTFTDCDDRRIDVEDLALPQQGVLLYVVDETLTIDLTGAISTTTSGTGDGPATSEGS